MHLSHPSGIQPTLGRGTEEPETSSWVWFGPQRGDLRDGGLRAAGVRLGPTLRSRRLLAALISSHHMLGGGGTMVPSAT